MVPYPYPATGLDPCHAQPPARALRKEIGVIPGHLPSLPRKKIGVIPSHRPGPLRKKIGTMLITRIRRIDEKTTPPLDLIDDRLIQVFWDRRTTFGATEIPALPDMLLAHIISWMHDDGTLMRMIIPARLYAIEPERITITPEIGISGDIKPQAAHITIITVGEPRCHQLA